MKKLLASLSLFFVLLGSASALDIPKRPEGYVSDYAGLVSKSVKDRLNRALYQYETETTNQIFVAVFDTLEEESLQDFTNRLFEAWGVGQKGRDNGVLLAIFKKEQKIWIEVGYGLEGVLPDALAGRIYREFIVPHFQAGHYDQGILAGVSAIIEATQGEFKALSRTRQTRDPYSRELTPQEIKAMRAQGMALAIGIGILVLILFLIDTGRYFGYRRGHRSSNMRYSFWEWFFRFAVLLFVLNMVFRIMFYMMLFSRGGYYGGRGGFRGFGGGGGGMSGGGGAGGGW